MRGFFFPEENICTPTRIREVRRACFSCVYLKPIVKLELNDEFFGTARDSLRSQHTVRTKPVARKDVVKYTWSWRLCAMIQSGRLSPHILHCTPITENDIVFLHDSYTPFNKKLMKWNVSATGARGQHEPDNGLESSCQQWLPGGALRETCRSRENMMAPRHRAPDFLNHCFIRELSPEYKATLSADYRRPTP